MKPSDIFGLIVRTLGVCLFLWSIWYFVFGLAEAVGLVTDTPGEKTSYFVTGVPGIIVAVVLMRCAPWFVRFSYPGDERKRDDVA